MSKILLSRFRICFFICLGALGLCGCASVIGWIPGMDVVVGNSDLSGSSDEDYITIETTDVNIDSTASAGSAETPVIVINPEEIYGSGAQATNLGDKTYAVNTVNSGTVTLAFAGDINFDDGYTNMNTLRTSPNGILDCFSSDLLAEMTSADIMMVNNEFPYSNGGSPTPDKQYTFRAKPERVSLLSQMGVDVVTLANNHAYDYGPQALLDTFTTLEDASIPYVGAGRNIDEAMKPAYFVANDMKIGIVAATQIERTQTPDTKEATESSPGVLRTLQPDKAIAAVTEAAAHSDFTIMYVHWGSENVTEVESSQRELAKKYVEAGADLIIGDHSHCLQGIEYIDGVPVIYSLGNFWFNSKALDTVLLKVVVNKNGILAYQFLPARQENCRTKLLAGSEKARVIQYMKDISFSVQIDANGMVTPAK